MRKTRAAMVTFLVLAAGCATEPADRPTAERLGSATGALDDVGTEADAATFAFDVSKAVASDGSPGDVVTAVLDGMKLVGDLGKEDGASTADQLATQQKEINRLQVEVGALQRGLADADARTDHGLQFSLEVDLDAARRVVLAAAAVLANDAPHFAISPPDWVLGDLTNEAIHLDQQILLFEQWLAMQPAPELVQAVVPWHRKVLASHIMAIAVRLHFAAAGVPIDANWLVARRDALARARYNTSEGYVDATLATPWDRADAKLRQLLDRAVNPYWSVRAAVDLSGDGYPDLVVHDAATGVVEIWEGGADFRLGTLAGEPRVLGTADPTEWSLRAVNDVNGDGYPDLVWTTASDRGVHAWLMTGMSRGATVDLADGWQAPLGDVNGDAKRDLFYVDYHEDYSSVPPSFDSQPPPRSPFGILVQPGRAYPTNPSNAEVMTLGPSVGTDWTMKGLADFNADGRSDVLWTQPATGRAVVWLTPGNAQYVADAPSTGAWHYDVQAVELSAVEDGGEILAVADFDRDGHPDVLAQRRDLGALMIYFLNGTSFKTFGFMFRREAAPPSCSASTSCGSVVVLSCNAVAEPQVLQRKDATGAFATIASSSDTSTTAFRDVPSDATATYRICSQVHAGMCTGELSVTVDQSTCQTTPHCGATKHYCPDAGCVPKSVLCE